MKPRPCQQRPTAVVEVGERGRRRRVQPPACAGPGDPVAVADPVNGKLGRGCLVQHHAARVERDFAWVPDHPVTDAYRAYKTMPYDRQTWDLTAVLYAIRPSESYFGLSAPGHIASDDAGRTAFTAAAGGSHRYLTLTEAQRARTLETMVMLASQPRQ